MRVYRVQCTQQPFNAKFTCQLLLLKVLHTATFKCTKEINSNAFRYLVYKLQVESLIITDRLIQ